MNIVVSAILFLVGLVLVIYFAEKLVKGAVGTSAGFGVSAFVISVIFIGFDPENLAVGAVGSYEAASGIALGSIIGAAMVAIALAFGVTALIVPMEFERAPRSVLAVPIAAVTLFAVLAWDGTLSRVDGGILLTGFLLAVLCLIWLSRRGLDIRPTGEVAETLEEKEPISRWKALGLLVISLTAIIAGSEMLVTGSKSIIDRFGLSETFFGMIVLALLVSVEEIARELPAALRGRPEITYGNVVGSILAFFCFNAGIIALVRPLEVSKPVLNFYLPVCSMTVLATTLFMLVRRVPRWAGAVLVLLYVVFVIGGYRIESIP
ncbi:MAG TPA: hypothetical protein PKD64_12515 [Pirellulaceae bacterium]|nr:hypothetical protein [Pirellulaceae bacterium]HMO93011.1 hypothetical protein [Pirellulaceae bacterium]HMP67911.1 hypothetical protein [Pirellulaceae bacterium]